MAECAVLYSGGTDSTCVASLQAERFDRVHLLTFEERGTRGSPRPAGNLAALRRRHGTSRFVHQSLSVDALVRRLSYERYLRGLARHGLFMLATPGFSSLSWHVRTLVYCLDNGIADVADGVTRELVHFPGHMEPVLELFRNFYAEFGVQYENPVRGWDVPPQQELLDRVIVDRHGYATLSDAPARKTTGTYLFEQGLLPHPNVKGSAFDRRMQHDCYPFVLFNIFAFWLYLPFHDRADYERRMTALMAEKISVARAWVVARRANGAASELAGLLA